MPALTLSPDDFQQAVHLEGGVPGLAGPWAFRSRGGEVFAVGLLPYRRCPAPVVAGADQQVRLALLGGDRLEDVLAGRFELPLPLLEPEGKDRLHEGFAP